MFCTYCHAEVSPSHSECPVCKKPITKAHSTCPNCSADMGPDEVTCKNCGYHTVLKKVIKLHETSGTPPAQTTLICSSCKKEIPVGSHFCEYCGGDVRSVSTQAMASPPPSKTSSESPTSAHVPTKPAIGFNEATLNALITMLDKKGVISIQDLESNL